MSNENLIKLITPDGARRVVALRGIPGSGKSTFAEEALKAFPGTVCRINNDDLCNAIFGKPWVPELGDSSQLFLEIRKSLLYTLLNNPKIEIVILDNTNLHMQGIRAMEKAAINLGVDFIVDDTFLHTPLEVCIERDANRARTVGEEVIRRMYETASKLEPYSYNRINMASDK